MLSYLDMAGIYPRLDQYPEEPYLVYSVHVTPIEVTCTQVQLIYR